MEYESLLQQLTACKQEEEARGALASFVQGNQTNFDVDNDTDQCKERLCRLLLEKCKTDQSDSMAWSHNTVTIALGALRILARQKSGCGPIVSDDGLHTLAGLSWLDSDNSGRISGGGVADHQLRVMVEAVKCLCNVVLKNQHLSGSCERLGVLAGLAHHLTHLRPCLLLHRDLIYYELRLLFLITACGQEQRVHFREQHDGVHVLLQLLDTILFPSTSSSSSAEERPVPDQSDSACCSSVHKLLPREGVVILPHPLDSQAINIIQEILKILFNQTVDKKDDDLEENELSIMAILVHMLRILLTSVPAQVSDSTMTLVGHCVEVLLNVAQNVSHCLLLPPSAVTTPTLVQWYPDLYPEDMSTSKCVREGGVSSGVGVVHLLDVDALHDEFNVAAVVNILNYLHVLLCDGKGCSLTPVLAALRQVSQGHRTIRRYLKSQILPPLGAVTQRPEQGESLKSKLVRLMLPGRHGAEEIVAELLFVLCKEDASRLTKHTGYGNAAGLLMSRGLLGGGRSKGAELYSSDSDDSDTEEYAQNKKIDPVTGGPDTSGDTRSPLDDMTEEEKEREAEQLHYLIEKMNAQGIIKMVPMGHNQERLVPEHHSSSSEDEK